MELQGFYFRTCGCEDGQGVVLGGFLDQAPFERISRGSQLTVWFCFLALFLLTPTFPLYLTAVSFQVNMPTSVLGAPFPP